MLHGGDRESGALEAVIVSRMGLAIRDCHHSLAENVVGKFFGNLVYWCYRMESLTFIQYGLTRFLPSASGASNISSMISCHPSLVSMTNFAYLIVRFYVAAWYLCTFPYAENAMLVPSCPCIAPHQPLLDVLMCFILSATSSTEGGSSFGPPLGAPPVFGFGGAF